jgi:hypothetical protein
LVKESREEIYEKKVKKGYSNSKNEFGLANFFQENNLGLGLYKGDNTFSQWSKITPNTNGTTTATPCP